MPKIRVRIAPSPTGPLHLGTARTALFNYLFARQQKGKFILRIEDTDLERSNKKFEKDIQEGLKWLGIKWDEGPLRQSQRIKTYTKYLKKLLAEDRAYYCYCTKKELAKERESQKKRGEPPKYSGRCRYLSKKELNKLKKIRKTSIIRFKTPHKKLIFKDLIRGKLTFDTSLIGDFSLAKNLTTPLYNFAVVIDDYTMKISHVVRGEDHISNTPKQILLQEALKFPHSQYGHLPLILGPDRSKLSKRHGATAITEYRELGYLPQAMTNYMALLGWNPKREQEIFSLPELIKEFSFKKINLSGAIFNIERLNWINGYYIRHIDLDQLTKLCIPFLKTKFQDKNYIKKVVTLEQERMKKLSEIKELTDFFFKKKIEYDPQLLFWKKMSQEEVLNSLIIARDRLTPLLERYFNKKDLEKVFLKLSEEKGIGTGELLWPLRVALTGRKASPGPFEVAGVLGKKMVLKRLEEAIQKL